MPQASATSKAPRRPYSPRGSSLRERLERYTDKTGQCWLWTGYQQGGYGRLDGFDTVLAHRLWWQELVGPLDGSDSTLDHMCQNKLCVNPAHLQVLDRVEHGVVTNERQAHCDDCTCRPWPVAVEEIPFLAGEVESPPRRYSSAGLSLEDKLGYWTARTVGCWYWLGTADRGRGRVFHEGRWLRAHRAWYEGAVGPIPEGLELDHLCRNRLCVRPDHMEPVTGEENRRRARHCPSCSCTP